MQNRQSTPGLATSSRANVHPQPCLHGRIPPALRHTLHMSSDPPAKELLRQLATGDPVSGEALATQLGVTRAAVWKQIAALRTLGLPIEARSRAGYRMPWSTQLLHTPSIISKLGTAPGAPIHLHWELDSTQDELARLLPDAPDLTVVLAEHQTLRARAAQPRLALAAGTGHHPVVPEALRWWPCSAVGAIDRHGRVRSARAGRHRGTGTAAQMAQRRGADHGKLAGILIEVGGEYDGPSVVRVGVGLNVRLSPAVHGTARSAR